MPVRRRRQPKRAKRKGNRRGRARIGTGNRAQMKPYKFVYKLAPQVLVSSQTAPSAIAMSTASGAGLLPVTGGTTPGGTISVQTSASLGLPGYVDFGIGQSFQLADCANFAALANRFDAYKIDRITLDLQWLNNISAVNSGGCLPTFWFAFDQDDSTTPVLPSTVTGIVGARKWQPTSSKTNFKFSFKPSNLVNLRTVTAGTAGSTQLIMPKGYINCGVPNATHMGLKMYCTDWYAPGAGVVNCLRFNWTYHVSYRSPIDCR